MASAIDKWRSLGDYRADISRYVAQGGPNSYNLIAITLRQIEREYGPVAVYLAIEELNLRRKYGIEARRV